MKRTIDNICLTLAITLSAVLLCSCSEGRVISKRPDSASASVNQLITRLMSENDIPGMAVAVSYNGSDYFYSHGVLDRKSERVVTQDTIFEIGSVSKLFTVTLAAQAEREGLISLDAPIGNYLDELAGTPLGELPIYHLATHTAGGFPLQLPEHVETETDLYAYFRSWKPGHPAGTQRHYANPSIGLLGVLVAKMKGERFSNLMKQELFPAIGATRTFITVPDAAVENYAWGHNRKGERVRVNPALLAAEAYGVKTTSADLLKFLKLNLNGSEISSSLTHSAQRTHTGYYDTEFFQQALIWEKYAYPIDPCKLKDGNAYKMIMEASAVTAMDPAMSDQVVFALSKTGSTGGFGAYVLIVPHENFALLLLANKNYPIGERVETAYRIAVEFLSFSTEYCE